MTKLYVCTESMKVSLGGGVTAGIWIDMDGFSFPCERWNDFAIVVMRWWASALLQLMKSEIDQLTVDFMDGPYAVEIKRALFDGGLVLRAIEGDGRRTQVAIAEVDILDFGRNFVDEAHKVIKKIEELGWWSEDADVLDRSLNEIVAELMRKVSTKKEGGKG